MGYFPRFSLPKAAMDETLPVDMKFEAALAGLEKIVRDMEGGELQLEESIAAYQRGAALLQHCRQQLANAEQQLRVFECADTRNDIPTPTSAP